MVISYHTVWSNGTLLLLCLLLFVLLVPVDDSYPPVRLNSIFARAQPIHLFQHPIVHMSSLLPCSPMRPPLPHAPSYSPYGLSSSPINSLFSFNPLHLTNPSLISITRLS